jgi:hypothetical protein
MREFADHEHAVQRSLGHVASFSRTVLDRGHRLPFPYRD